MKDNTDLRRIHAGLLCGCSSALLLKQSVDFEGFEWLNCVVNLMLAILCGALIYTSGRLAREHRKQNAQDFEKEK